MDTPDETTGPINLGNPKELTIIELAEMILNLSGSSSKILRKPLPQDDPQQRKPDISLARETLQWEPKVPLETGLRNTIEYFDDLLLRSGRKEE
jgi:UDP-glucuronate decarboxylase